MRGRRCNYVPVQVGRQREAKCVSNTPIALDLAHEYAIDMTVHENAGSASRGIVRRVLALRVKDELRTLPSRKFRGGAIIVPDCVAVRLYTCHVPVQS